MGDVIMTAPALRALKDTFKARITLLTSSMGGLIAPHIAEIDRVIIADVPWVKTTASPLSENIIDLARELQSYRFDLAVIFTVYSQNSLPAAMLAFLAGIPRRLAYCRENPYHLLTDWVPDQEPYSYILHQVQRDLQLVKAIGASTIDDRLRVSFREEAQKTALQKLSQTGMDLNKAWILLHPGVSEKKREYPVPLWIEAGRLLQKQMDVQLLVTGSGTEQALALAIQTALWPGIWSLAGLLNLEEFIALIAASLLVVSVNTATIHIAAALNIPSVVLYAQTNPQHTPWKGRSDVIFYSVPSTENSRNEVIRHVSRQLYRDAIPPPHADRVLQAVQQLLHKQQPGTAAGAALPFQTANPHNY